MLENWKRLALRSVRVATKAVRRGLETEICVECDECGERFCRRFLKEDVMAVDVERIESHLHAQAREEGWAVEDGGMKCSECVNWQLEEVEDE